MISLMGVVTPRNPAVTSTPGVTVHPSIGYYKADEDSVVGVVVSLRRDRGAGSADGAADGSASLILAEILLSTEVLWVVFDVWSHEFLSSL
jgi:hypothetical protein